MKCFNVCKTIEMGEVLFLKVRFVTSQDLGPFWEADHLESCLYNTRKRCQTSNYVRLKATADKLRL